MYPVNCQSNIILTAYITGKTGRSFDFPEVLITNECHIRVVQPSLTRDGGHYSLLRLWTSITGPSIYHTSNIS